MTKEKPAARGNAPKKLPHTDRLKAPATADRLERIALACELLAAAAAVAVDLVTRP